ncbi:MAG: class I SAM-dependent methyltransferase [Dehalococcoidia bacterium]
MGILGFGWRAPALRERFYPPEFLGMYARFLKTILGLVQPGDVVLDAGCGSGRVFQHQLAGHAKLVLGIDVTDEPRENENIDGWTHGDLRALPLRDASFDLIVMSHVAEHLTEPEAVFGELARILRPGGRLLVLTPNRWHYVTLVARLVPHRLHVVFNRWRGLDAGDIFPTAYRANTAGRLRELSQGAGLSVERLDQFESEPEYLAFHIVPYALGVVYERLVNRFSFLAPLRVELLLVARRS